jgi:hypothetical protein
MSTDPRSPQPVSAGALLLRQFAMLLLLIVSLAISLTFLFLQAPQATTTPSRHILIWLQWEGLRPDMISATVTPNVFNLGDVGVEATDQHALAPMAASLGIPLSGTTAPPVPMDPTLALVQAATAKGIPVTYEGAGGAEISQQTPGATTLSVIDGTTVVPATLTAQIEKANLPLPGTLPAPTAATLPDAAHTENLAQIYSQVLLPQLAKGNGSFLSIIRFDDPALTAQMAGIGSGAFVAALRENDRALGEIIQGLDAVNLVAPADVIISSDMGISDVAQTLPGQVDRTDLAGMLTSAAKLGAAGPLAMVGNNGVSQGSITPATTVVVDAEGGYDTITFPATAAVTALGQGQLTVGQELLANVVIPYVQQQAQVGTVFVNDALGVFQGTLAESLIGLTIARLNPPAAVVTFQSAPLQVGQPATNIAGYAGVAQADTTDLATWGNLSRRDLHTVLFLNGPDFKQGFRDEDPSSAWDVVPTLETALGITSAPATPGRVLSEILANNTGTGMDAVSQDVKSASLTLANGNVLVAVLVTESFGGERYIHASAVAQAPGSTATNTILNDAVQLADQE